MSKVLEIEEDEVRERIDREFDRMAKRIEKLEEGLREHKSTEERYLYDIRQLERGRRDDAEEAVRKVERALDWIAEQKAQDKFKDDIFGLKGQLETVETDLKELMAAHTDD